MQKKSHSSKKSGICQSLPQQKITRPVILSYAANQVTQNSNYEASNQQEQDQQSSHQQVQVNNCQYYSNGNTLISNGYSKKKEDGLSQLSLIIYEGLDKARKQVHSQRLISKIQLAYKKQLQLQLQLTKQLERLVRYSIMSSNSNQVEEKVIQLQQQVQTLKKQMQQIQAKINTGNCIGNQYNKPSQIYEPAQQYYTPDSDIKIYNGNNNRNNLITTPKYKLINNNDKDKYRISRESTDNDNKLVSLKSPRSPRTLEVQNISTSGSPSRASITSTKKLKTQSTGNTNKNLINQQKLLLIQRKNIIKQQIQQSCQAFTKKFDMISTQINILKKEIQIADEQLEKYECIHIGYSSNADNAFAAGSYNYQIHINQANDYNSQSNIKNDKRLQFSNLYREKTAQQRNIERFRTNDGYYKQKCEQNYNGGYNYPQSKPRIPRFRSQNKQQLGRTPQARQRTRQKAKHTNMHLKSNNAYSPIMYHNTNKNKTRKPSMFWRARAGNNSPLLARCRSQNKFISTLSQLQNNVENHYGEIKNSNVAKSKNMFRAHSQSNNAFSLSGNQYGRYGHNQNNQANQYSTNAFNDINSNLYDKHNIKASGNNLMSYKGGNHIRQTQNQYFDNPTGYLFTKLASQYKNAENRIASFQVSQFSNYQY